MSLIRMQHVSIRMDGQSDDLFQDISLEVNPHDRIGLIGPNGCGKTTILRMLIGDLQPEEGQVIRSNKIGDAGYLRQKSKPLNDATLLQAAMADLSEISALSYTIQHLELQMADLTGEMLDKAVVDYGEAIEKYHQAGGYDIEQDVINILVGLGFTENDISSPFVHLSSGQRTRVGLAQLLIRPTDLLLLDEPTNHLDIAGQNWLEDYLRRFPGAVLMVSHDRFFLDKTVSCILELRRGNLRQYTGDYSDYATQRQQEEAAAWEQYERAGKEVKRLRSSVGERKRMARKVQGSKATAGGSADFYHHKAAKVMKRAKAIERRVEQQIEKRKTGKPFMEKRTVLSFPPVSDPGGTLLEAVDISKRFGEKILFDKISFSIQRGQRIGMLGRNGSGKTTLLKILLNQIEPDQGLVRKGRRIKIGYYGQEQEGLNLDRTILEDVLSIGNVDETWARIVLGALLLRREKVHHKIKDLSIGEQGRVALSKLLLSGANVLLLDEPTNHLDIDAREAVEGALLDYPGAMIFVSHDRRLIEHLADGIIEIADAHASLYPGPYEEYVGMKMRAQERDK